MTMNWEALAIFLVGIFACVMMFFNFNPDGTVTLNTFDDVVAAPSDHISEKDILVLDDRLVINISNVKISNYAETGSMLPFFDKGANGIQVVPESEDDVEVGDIISYEIEGVSIVHRVVEKGVDERGTYFVIKGDANLAEDGKIRFKDIERIVVGILY